MANKVLKRSETDKNYTWRLEDIYPDTDAWRAEYAEAVKVAEEIESYKGKIGESSADMPKRERTERMQKQGHIFTNKIQKESVPKLL